jgi:hypothetical protein
VFINPEQVFSLLLKGESEMKLLKGLFITLFVVCAYGVFTVDVHAQCVYCKPKKSVFVCAPATSGGNECATDEDATLCGLDSPCGGELQRPTVQSKIRLNEQILKEIGKVQPRFAVILAFVNRQNLLSKGQARIFMMPGEISEDDVEQAINPSLKKTLTKEYLKELRDRTQKGNQAEVSPLEYEITLEESSNFSTGLIRLKVVLGYEFDLVYSTLEINVETKGKTASEKKIWQASNWRIN